MLPFSWQEIMFSTVLWSFQRGTVSLCLSNGCKIKIHQTLRMIKSPGTQTQIVRMWFDSNQVAKIFFKPQTLKAHIFAAHWPTETHSTSYKRSWHFCYHSFFSKDWQHFIDRFCSLRVRSEINSCIYIFLHFVTTFCATDLLHHLIV